MIVALIVVVLAIREGIKDEAQNGDEASSQNETIGREFGERKEDE